MKPYLTLKRKGSQNIYTDIYSMW